MDRLVYFLLGFIIGAFVEPALAILIRDWAKIILYKRIQREFQKAVAVGLEEVQSRSQGVDSIELATSLRDKARLN